MKSGFKIAFSAGLTVLDALFLGACCCGCCSASECPKTEPVPTAPTGKTGPAADGKMDAPAASAQSAGNVRSARPAYESYQLKVVPVQKKNVYKAGEKIQFRITLADKTGKPVIGQKIGYAVSSGDGKLQKNIITKTDGKPLFCEASLDAPGWIRVLATLLDENGKPLLKRKRAILAGAGAMVEPEKIRAGCDEPADFNKFWEEQKAALAKVPVRAERTPVPLTGRQADRFQCYDVKVDCVNQVPVSGYLTMPLKAKPKSLPAVVSYHGAGVRSASRIFRNNAICFDVNAHGILNGQTRAYYNNLRTNELRNYYYRNKNDREKFYFRDMYLRVLRALDYVKTLPEWDGKNLIVVGSSQGGAQALVAAALDPQVSLCLSGVPAMSDHSGNLLGRQSGWPRLFAAKNGKPVDVKTAEASKYYDNVNFAKYIKAPVYMTVGMIDNTCVPTSVYAVFNNLPAATEKHMTIFPTEGHVGKNPAGYKAINKVVRSKAGK